MWASLKKFASCLKLNPIRGKLHADADGVTIERLETSEHYHFCWVDVDEIHTFKVDLGTTDDIRLAFRLSDSWYEISEQDDGFSDVVATMRHRFSSIPADWYDEVTLPPFATNHTVLWARTR